MQKHSRSSTDLFQRAEYLVCRGVGQIGICACVAGYGKRCAGIIDQEDACELPGGGQNGDFEAPQNVRKQRRQLCPQRHVGEDAL